MGDFYYVCPEKTTLDVCCFKGTSDECYEWIKKKEPTVENVIRYLEKNYNKNPLKEEK
jgi:hypothetical protein